MCGSWQEPGTAGAGRAASGGMMNRHTHSALPDQPRPSEGPAVQPGPFRERCRGDSDCPDAQKCCNSSCGHQCLPGAPAGEAGLGQDGTGRDRTGTGRDRMGQDGTGWHRMGEDGIGWHRMAQDGTGWDRTGQDGTRWHRTGSEGGEVAQRPGMAAATMAQSCGTNGTLTPCSPGWALPGVGLEWGGKGTVRSPSGEATILLSSCRGHQPCPRHSRAPPGPVGMPQGPGLSPIPRVLSPAVQPALCDKQPEHRGWEPPQSFASPKCPGPHGCGSKQWHCSHRSRSHHACREGRILPSPCRAVPQLRLQSLVLARWRLSPPGEVLPEWLRLCLPAPVPRCQMRAGVPPAPGDVRLGGGDPLLLLALPASLPPAPRETRHLPAG